MQVTEAQEFIQNLLDRLDRDGTKFTLPGGILTAREVTAFRVLAGLDPAPLEAKSDHREVEGKVESEFPLNLRCLTEACDEERVLCVDFGTAFSKAAVWEQFGVDPIPLPIGKDISANPLLIDSVIFLGSERISFGPKAMQELASEGDETRLLFTSPKEILTLDYESIQNDRPSAAIDPHKAFKKKELLVLFLGFLTALTSRELKSLKIDGNVRRRFAAPGWGDAQPNAEGKVFDRMTAQLRRFLAEAQILSDSFTIDQWLNGIEIKDAKAAIAQLNKLNDSQLQDAPFIERPVLEVVAAASSMKEQLLNKRPQVVVVDVGAGTTDLGAFKYVGASDSPKFASYANGMAALEIAGNRLDDALKMLVREKLGLGEDSTAKPKLERNLAQNTQFYKKELFENGLVIVSIVGLPDVEITLSEFMASKIVVNFESKFREKVLKLLGNADKAGGVSFTGAASENYVVFTGGGGSLPFLHKVFEGGLKLPAGTAYFQKMDPRPRWLEDASEEAREVFPQIAVSVGGASPDLPKQLPTVLDTSQPGEMSLAPMYKS